MDIKDRVLVIEDDKSIRNFFRPVLEANNYDVLIATTGAEGYSMVTSQCPDEHIRRILLLLHIPDDEVQMDSHLSASYPELLPDIRFRFSV